MRSRFAWASAAALAFTLTSPIETKAAYTNLDGIVITNGVILMTTRSASDDWWHRNSGSGLYDGDDAKGPGSFSPGDTCYFLSTAANAAFVGELSSTVQPNLALFGQTDSISPNEISLHRCTG
jgi:hypothetical protein